MSKLKNKILCFVIMMLFLLHNIGTIIYAKCIEDDPTTTKPTTLLTTTHHTTKSLNVTSTCPSCICKL